VVFFRVTPANQAPSYPDSETPAPLKDYRYVKARITSTGGYEGLNVPFFDVDAYNKMVGTEDRLEGVRAFNEKRKPKFQGK